MAQVTEVRFRSAKEDGKVKAVATVILDGQYAVHGLLVVEGPNGLFVATPYVRTATGDYRDIFYPVTAEAREELHGAVLDAYAVWAGQAPQEGAG